MPEEIRRARPFEFVLVLPGIKSLTSAVMNALFDAGCEDATPSLRFERLFLTFERDAPTLEDAVVSALSDVRRALGT